METPVKLDSQLARDTVPPRAALSELLRDPDFANQANRSHEGYA